MTHYHAVVWLDHAQAKVFQFNPTDVQAKVVHAHGGAQGHIHHRAGVTGSGHSHGDPAFFKSVEDALSGVSEVLVLGPGAAKQEFVHHIGEHAKPLAKKIAAVETVDHLTDNQIVAHARAYFDRTDRMRPQKG
jgi:stalled ribosome rescue protein Dom34